MVSGRFWLDSGGFWLDSGGFWLDSGGFWLDSGGFGWFHVLSITINSFKVIHFSGAKIFRIP